MNAEELEAAGDRLIEGFLDGFEELLTEFMADITVFGKSIDESTASPTLKTAIAQKLLASLDQLDTVADRVVSKAGAA